MTQTTSSGRRPSTADLRRHYQMCEDERIQRDRVNSGRRRLSALRRARVAFELRLKGRK